jgi:allophanate hydrolase
MFNGCVGVKPTVGRLSTLGVVPAAKALDCVTVFSQSVADGAAIVRLMEVCVDAGSLY